MPTARQGVNNVDIEQIVTQRVAKAMAVYEAKRNSGNGTHQILVEVKEEFGTKGVVSLAIWFEKMEYVFHISNYATNCQVKYATCTLLDSALTWWNSHVKTVGIDAAYEMYCVGIY
ncbi:hypothetical protein Tco_1097628 [Tanacetum coccineum]